MRDSKNHLELDGNFWRIAESAEGDGYSVEEQPLRPPNAVTVQGESSQKFQPRPDLLIWNWTDWSAGEGRRKQKFGESGRSWQLNGVRAFEEPGHLIPGYYLSNTKDSGGVNDFNNDLVFVVAVDTLYGFDQFASGADVYTWNNSSKRWSTVTTLTGPAARPSRGGSVGDQEAVYWAEESSQNVWKLNSGVATTVSSGTVLSVPGPKLAQTDDYLYYYAQAGNEVWEISKAGTSTTLIDSWTGFGKTQPSYKPIAKLGGKIYLLSATQSETTVREITPTSAAGTGFGAEILNIPGFIGQSMWSHSGTLFIYGSQQDLGVGVEEKPAILYFTPGGNYGSLGELRPDDSTDEGATTGAVRMLDSLFVTPSRSSSDDQYSLFQIDSISGGIACVAYDEGNSGNPGETGDVIAFDNQIFISSASQTRILRADPSRYAINSNAISTEHDFDLVGNKFLSSMALSCQPLPADWTVYVDYQVNGDGTWTNAITYTTDNGTGTTALVTTDASTVEFKSLQMRIRFSYTGAGIPTTAPVVLGVEARAVVAEKVKVFNLLIDLSTDQSAGRQSKAGSNKITLMQATLAKKVAIDFKDGYGNPNAGQWSQYDVFVDSSKISLSSPGEGVVALKLREVV